MADRVRYLLVTKPAALTTADWATSLNALKGAINRRFDAPNPIQRLHPRASLDNTKVLLHGDFDDDDITVANAATVVYNALKPKYTLAQCNTAMSNNVAVLTHAEALALVAGAEWEAANP